MQFSFSKLSGVLLSAMVLAGCAVGPAYEPPEVAMPAQYKQADAAEHGQWQVAQPRDDAMRGAWWWIWDDAQLNALQEQAQAANPHLQAAAARLMQARAMQRSTQAERSVRIDAGLGGMRQRSPGQAPDTAQPVTLWRAQVGLAYEPDLFQRIANTVSAAEADSQQVAALYHSAMLTLQADVASHYFLLRQRDAEVQLYQKAVQQRQANLRLIERRFDSGDISELGLARARTELAQAQADAVAMERERALTEHTLATLLGQTPAQFHLPAAPLQDVAQAIPPGLPSQLLERRPDIAAAERAMAAANARIGVAQAAFFPRLTLTSALGFESSELGQLMQWSSRAFLLGPLVGTALSLPLWDGGARKAGVQSAQAGYEQAVAEYRETVLTAFREVEDGLVRMRTLAQQRTTQAQAVQAAERARHLSQVQYREGMVSYLDVIEADRTALMQRHAVVQLMGAQAHAMVHLIRALGGGWDASVSEAQVAAVAP